MILALSNTLRGLPSFTRICNKRVWNHRFSQFGHCPHAMWGYVVSKFSNIHSTFLDKADAERVVPGVLMTETVIYQMSVW